MVFSSFVFLFLFLPSVLLCYYLTPSRLRNYLALLASYLFYAWGAPTVVGALFLSSLADYLLIRLLTERAHRPHTKRLILSAGLLLNIGLLGYYKYANFFIEQTNALFARVGLSELPWTEIALPIGISFFTFQKLSYLVDVYRAKAPPAKSFVNYALYVALFPQLIAGPIVRYHDIASQLEARHHSLHGFFEGMCRFCLGLAKKVIIADSIGAVADNVFRLPEESLSLPYAWVGVICYSFQIYFDFSGYSDMAIGLGRMLGFRFLENFDRPYISQTFTEFWRRWHISLSNWMREYLYIPLGGNRVSRPRMYLNLSIVFFLSGLWHGADWTFILWGMYHGAFLIGDKVGWLSVSKRLPKAINIALTFVLVCLGWVLFRSESLSQAAMFYTHMWNPAFFSPDVPVFRGDVINNRAIVVLIFAALISFAPAYRGTPKLRPYVNDHIFSVARGTFAIVCFVLAVASLSTAEYVPFLYFRF